MHDWITVNREYFDVKIFSDSMACAKITAPHPASRILRDAGCGLRNQTKLPFSASIRMKYMRNINDNVVQGRLSENYLTQKIIA